MFLMRRFLTHSFVGCVVALVFLFVAGAGGATERLALQIKRWPDLPTAPLPAMLANGNVTGVEYGDAVYRRMFVDGAPNYNHGGIFAGLRSSDGDPRVLEVIGIDLPDNTTGEVGFIDYFLEHGPDYYGAYTLEGVDLTFEQRRAIVATARELSEAVIPFTTFQAITYRNGTYGGLIDSITGIRCDGFVEFAYELHGHKVWWNTRDPSQWNILNWPGRHNELPGLFSNPGRHFTPWAQRGAPSYSGTNPNNTMLTHPSPAMPPGYEVIQTRLSDGVRVVIRAEDVSGIHRIYALPPGADEWIAGEVGPQHPVSAASELVVEVRTEGDLTFFAIDGAGNAPLPDAYPSVRIDWTKTAADPAWLDME